MKTVIIHLSDIHLKSKHDLALTYIPKIGNILNDISMEAIGHMIIAISGDIAFSGKKEEYQLANTALLELKNAILASHDIKLDFLCAPGNHDCDFSKDDAVRELIVSSIPSEQRKISDAKLIEQCVKVQEAFFDFQQSSIFTQPTKDGCKVYQEYKLDSSHGELYFRCYNTAWVSQLKEQPGKMSYPRLYMDDTASEPRAGLTVSMLHHPTNWLTPNRRRNFDHHLDSTSDLILLGHEHLPEEYIKSDFDGNKVGYIYGGAFQEGSKDCPGHFNVITIDEESQQYQINSYTRRKDLFEKRDTDAKWEPLLRNTKYTKHGLHLTESYVDWVTDPEVDFAHYSGKRLLLDDLFIMPDFKSAETKDSSGETSNKRNIPAGKFDEFITKNNRIILYGRERCGKTTLAKRLFWTFFKDDKIPVYLDGSTLSKGSISGLDKLLRKQFCAIFTNPDLPLFDQAPASRRALILDNLHLSKLNARGRLLLISKLQEKFSTMIIFGDPLMMVEEVASGVVIEKSLPDFAKLHIRELGRFGRRKLIRRWFSIGSNYSAPPSEVDKQVVRAEKTINTLLGNSFLPSNPIFVLGFLQTLDATMKKDQVGICGYHYEVFITNSLRRSANKANLDVKYRFLSELAYHLHRKNRTDLEPWEFQKLFSSYCKKYKRHPDRDTVLQELLESRLLEFFDGTYRFRYSYAYNFFVARYFNEHLEDQNIRDEVKDMCQSFHIEKNADIWLFLVHLSKSPFLLECISREANKLFSDAKPAALEGDVEFLRTLTTEKLDLKLPDIRTEEDIENHYEGLDQTDVILPEDTASDLEPEDRQILGKVDAMVRMIMVLGQILKNFPGSLTGDEKTRLVQDTFNLSLRGLSTFLGWFQEGKSEFVDYVLRRITSKNKEIEINDKLRDQVTKSLFWLMEMNILGLIRVTSSGVGAEGEEETFHEVTEEIGSNAAQLINVSISLDTLKVPQREVFRLNEKFSNDILCSNLLKSLIAQHFYLYPEDQGIRDKVCSKLGIGTFERGRGLPSNPQDRRD